jgi:hypothetical protein
VKKWGLREDNTSFAKAQTITRNSFFIYGEHQIHMNISDSAGKMKQHHPSFLAADIQGEALVLGYPWLATSNLNVNWPAKTWRYALESTNIEVCKPQEFFEDMKAGKDVYAVFYRPDGSTAFYGPSH